MEHTCPRGRQLVECHASTIAASNNVASVVELEGLVSFVEPWLVELLSPAARVRLVNAAFEAEVSRAASTTLSLYTVFRWMLPWLEADQIDRPQRDPRLVQFALKFYF